SRCRGRRRSARPSRASSPSRRPGPHPGGGTARRARPAGTSSSGRPRSTGTRSPGRACCRWRRAARPSPSGASCRRSHTPSGGRGPRRARTEPSPTEPPAAPRAFHAYIGPSMGVLELVEVSKRYGDGTLALADVDLAVAAGEVVAVVGPSGSGKTTLLRLAAGLERATDGAVRVAAGRAGSVFQDATLLPWRRVRGNVELPAELEGVARAERRERAERAIELVGLTGQERRLPH